MQPLVQLSDAVAAHVAAAAPLVTAIRIGANRVISGIVWRADMVVTADQALPAQDTYSLGFAGGSLLPARAARRDSAVNLVCLNLETATAPTTINAAAAPAVGSLVLVVGAAADGDPTVRLSAVHRIARGRSNGGGSLGDAIILDLAGHLVPEGGPVFDARGGLLGMSTAGPQGEAMVIPHATIARFLDPLTAVKALPLTQQQHNARRGWLGVALQPIMVPGTLRMIAGQSSGRMVVGVTSGGPAEQAGMRLGDVVLAIDGKSVSGQQGLRTVVGPDRVGSAIEVRVLREGNVASLLLTVAPQPD